MTSVFVYLTPYEDGVETVGGVGDGEVAFDESELVSSAGATEVLFLASVAGASETGGAEDLETAVGALKVDGLEAEVPEVPVVAVDIVISPANCAF